VDLAYEARVLDVLRCGMRCVPLRSPKHGSRIVGCALLVRIRDLTRLTGAALRECGLERHTLMTRALTLTTPNLASCPWP
jgi:hypothetical protein